jgi:hypothetical protein
MATVEEGDRRQDPLAVKVGAQMLERMRSGGHAAAGIIGQGLLVGRHLGKRARCQGVLWRACGVEASGVFAERSLNLTPAERGECPVVSSFGRL